MSFNPTIEVTSISGTVKKISANKIAGDMREDAVWYSTDASTITSVPVTLSNANKEWVIWERSNSIKVKFTPDGSAGNGQGYIAIGGMLTWTVDAVSGTVYIIRRKYQNMADNKASIYANANRAAASVGDTLNSGDAILCAAASSSFTLKLTAPAASDTTWLYYLLAVVQLGLAD